MTAVDVDALDKLREAATAGPWIPMLGYDSGRVVTDADGESVAHYVSTADAALIVAAVNALPDLLAEVRRGRALREAVEGLAAEYDDGPEWAEATYHGHVVRDRIRAVLAAVDEP